MFDIQVLKSLEEKLAEGTKAIRLVYYIEPINAKEQKEDFLMGRVKNPRFLYRDLEYDPQETEKILKSIQIPNDKWGTIFEKKKNNALLASKIISHRGNVDIIRETSIDIYGFPEIELVSYAQKILKDLPYIETKKEVPSVVIKNEFEKSLLGYGLSDWQVDFSEKRLTTVYPSQKKISLCKDRKFSINDSERLKVHEISVHVLRTANACLQPLNIFKLGFPDYLSTEEGLAAYMEEVTGNSSTEIIRDYAARVIAVDSICKGLSFRQNFDKLMSFNFSEEQAWNLAFRVHRGGCLTKDYSYLNGLLKIRNFVRKGGDLKILYVGKIGVDDVPFVNELIKKGVIQGAKYLPDFLC